MTQSFLKCCQNCCCAKHSPVKLDGPAGTETRLVEGKLSARQEMLPSFTTTEEEKKTAWMEGIRTDN